MHHAHLFEIRSYRPGDLDAAAETANAACRQAYAFFGYNHPVSMTRTRLGEALTEGQRCEAAAASASSDRLRADGRSRVAVSAAPNRRITAPTR